MDTLDCSIAEWDERFDNLPLLKKSEKRGRAKITTHQTPAQTKMEVPNVRSTEGSPKQALGVFFEPFGELEFVQLQKEECSRSFR